MGRSIGATLAILGLLLVCGCGDKGKPSGDKPLVVVSIPPQEFLVRRIAGEAVDVHVLVKPGDDPHHYQPTQREMVRVSDAEVYFTTGVDFEHVLVPKLREMTPDLPIVDTTRDIGRIAMEDHQEDHHHEDPHLHSEPGSQSRGHQEGQMDPHVWLSPLNASKQAAVIAEVLSKQMPEHAERFQENLRALQADLQAVHAEIRDALGALEGRKLYVFHPAFGYFAREYGLEQVAVEAAGKSPGPQRIRRLIELAKADGVKVIFVHPQFSDAGAKAIANEIGGAVVPLDPLAGDYIANLRRIAESVRESFGQ